MSPLTLSKVLSSLKVHFKIEFLRLETLQWKLFFSLKCVESQTIFLHWELAEYYNIVMPPFWFLKSDAVKCFLSWWHTAISAMPFLNEVTCLLFVSVLHSPFYQPNQFHCVLNWCSPCVDLRCVPVTLHFTVYTVLNLIYVGLL